MAPGRLRTTSELKTGRSINDAIDISREEKMNPPNVGMRTLIVVAACIVLPPFSSCALAAGDGEQPWQFEFTPYLFAPGLEGTTGVLGVTADVQVPFEEVFDNVDSFFMAIFEARRGKWLFLFDAMSFHLSGVGTKS